MTSLSHVTAIRPSGSAVTAGFLSKLPAAGMLTENADPASLPSALKTCALMPASDHTTTNCPFGRAAAAGNPAGTAPGVGPRSATTCSAPRGVPSALYTWARISNWAEVSTFSHDTTNPPSASAVTTPGPNVVAVMVNSLPDRVPSALNTCPRTPFRSGTPSRLLFVGGPGL